MRRMMMVAAAALVGLAAVGSPARAVVNTLGLWRLGEDDPGSAHGAIGNPLTVGTLGGADLGREGNPTYSSLVTAPGFSSRSVLFDGTDDLYFTTTVPSVATDNFGLEAWVNPTAVDGFNFAVSNGRNTNGGWGIVQIGGNWHIIHSGVAASGAGPAVALNAWTHVAMVRDNGLTTLYVNGAATGATIGLAPVPPLDRFMIGANKVNSGFEGRFKGFIDHVRVFEFDPGDFNASDLSYPTVVPEPSSMALALIGVALVAGRAIRQRRRAEHVAR